MSMLPRHEHERAYRLHRQRLFEVKPNLDTKPPREVIHLRVRRKQIKNEEDRLNKVDEENNRLLEKMTSIMRSGGKVDNWNEQPIKRTNNEAYKRRKQEELMMENVQIAKRLEAVKPYYDRQSWEEDFKKHSKYVERRQEYNREYYDLPRKKSNKKKKSVYEDDFESDDEKLPPIEQKKEKDKIKKEKKGDQTKLPKISPRTKEGKDSSRADKNQKKDKTKKDDGEDKKDMNDDREVKQLFKLAKGLIAEPEASDVFIKTLVKKTHKERMDTKAKFKEKYDQDLDKELKQELGKDYNVIIDALLTEQDSADASNLNNAIESKNITGIVEILSTKDNKSLSSLKDAYRKEYSKSVESAISEKTEAPVELLLTTLAKTGKDESTEVDGKAAQKDAVELYESGDGRWTTESGKFLKMVDSKSPSHIKSVFNLYKQVSGGKEALDAMKSECSSEYADAVTCYVNSTKDPQGFYADKLFKNIGATNPEFVNTLVARSEIDMPQICKTYKKKYDADISEDIDDVCKEPVNKVLKAMVGKSSKQKKSDNNNTQKGNKSSPSKAKSNQTNKNSKNTSKTPVKHEGPTVTADENFNPDDDCERLRKAMEGFGTDEQTIIDIICSKSNEQRQTLKKKYAEKYKKRDLEKDLKSELSGDFEEVILALMMTPSDYDVHCFHESMSGLGTDEAMLVSLLASKTPAEMKTIKADYKKVYKKELDKAIQSDTSGELREFLLALSKGDRPQGTDVDKKQAEEDAKRIHMDGKGKPEEGIFQELMTKRNPAQVKATFEEYKKISGKDAYETIKKEVKGDAKDAYILVGKVGEGDPVTFYAEQLKDASEGLGTKDSRLISIIVGRSEIDLATIKGKYKKLYKKSVNEMVESECSGDYKKALIKILGDK